MHACSFATTILSFIGRSKLQYPESPYVQQDLFNAAAKTRTSSVVCFAADEPMTSQTETLKAALLRLGEETERGFDANEAQRNQAQSIIAQLQELNPTQNPTQSYSKQPPINNDDGAATLEGSWTLVYTDAPDITNLRPQNSFFGELGRIGQRCDPPLISNIIEWKRPSWASTLPFTKSRILQKVVVEAEADESKLGFAKLRLSGIKVDTDDGVAGPKPFLNLSGPLTLPFGEFRVLYLDGGFRVTKTGQGYMAVNQRTAEGNGWF